jgi:hypothetical protein
MAIPLTTVDIGIQLLMDSTVSLREIEARLTARAFVVVDLPKHGQAVGTLLEQLLLVLIPALDYVPCWCSPVEWGLGAIRAVPAARQLLPAPFAAVSYVPGLWSHRTIRRPDH